MAKLTHIVVATWFYENQPGYQGYRYRLQALAERYKVTLLLRNKVFEKEFADLPIETRVFSTKGTSAFEQLRYIRLAHVSATAIRPIWSYCSVPNWRWLHFS